MSSSEESQEKVQKDKGDAAPAKVHSANSWESADLGDDERKKKFLKLMGASKSQHQGRFVIGEKEVPPKSHTRDSKQTDEINRELEDQYKHTMEHRITKWSHKGLGYEKDDNDTRDSTASGDSTPADSSGKDNSKKSENDKTENQDKKSEESDKRKHDKEESKQSSETPPKKPKMMMSFVKASDS